MKTKHLLKVLIIFVLAFSSCQKEWPNNFIEQYRMMEGVNEQCEFVNILSGVDEKVYLDKLLTAYKQNYSNYSDFEKTLNDNPKTIKRINISCAKSLIKDDINLLWRFIEQKEGVSILKSNLSTSLYNKYKDLFMSKITNEFNSMYNFLDRTVENENEVVQLLDKIDNEVGEIIIKQYKLEQANIERLKELLDNESSLNGELDFFNNTGEQLNLYVVYYYNGLKWQGWVTEGKFSFSPGQTISLKIPLNDYGYINRYFYYYAENTDRTLCWYDDNQFIVSEKIFKIPNVDLSSTLKLCSDFKLLGFKKWDIGSDQNSQFTLTFTSNK